MSEELYNSNDYCKLAEELEELKRENEELVSDKTYLINAAMDGGDKYHYTAHDIAYRDLERKCKALEAENVALREYIEGLDPRWIPVSERLPEATGDYIVTCDGWSNSEIAYWNFPDSDNPSGWLEYMQYIWSRKPVKYWMPLPQPPEVQE